MLLLAAACSAPPPKPSLGPTPDVAALRLDEVAWYDELQEKRPELLAQHAGRIDDPGWQALVIRPRWRPEIAGSAATYASIVAREYPASERRGDAAWAESLRDAQRALAPTPTLRPSGYPIEVYVGWLVGPDSPMTDELGLTYKVFFELDDVRTTLSPAGYLAFSRALESAGFVGDSKIDLRPGQVRFEYNDVIVHAPSIEMAECAERVGLESFAGELLHVARGVDVWWHGELLDWHHFLLTGDFDRLPPRVQTFVRHAEPLPDAPCP